MYITPDCCIICDGNYGVALWEENEKRRCEWNVFFPVKKNCCKRCSAKLGRNPQLDSSNIDIHKWQGYHNSP